MSKKKIVLKVEVCKGSKHWWWRMIAHNGQVLATSETYTAKNKCLKSAKKVAEQLGVKVVETTE